MKRNVLQEAQILKAIEILGEATENEIRDEIKQSFNADINEYDFLRNIRRWIARKCITLSKVRDETFYKLRDTPPFFKSLQVFQMKGISAKDADTIVMKLEAYYDSQKKDIGKGPLIKDYVLLKCTFQTIDKVAGGETSGEERFLAFPRGTSGKPYIPKSWLRGMFRDNARLANLTETLMANRVGFNPSDELDITLERVNNVKVAEGLCSYEVAPSGTEFTVYMRIPLTGGFKSVDHFKEFCKLFELAPISGLGAYSTHFGGRVRLLEATEVD